MYTLGQCPRVGRNHREIFQSSFPKSLPKSVRKFNLQERWASDGHESFVACFPSGCRLNKRLSMRHMEALIEIGLSLGVTTAHPCLRVPLEGLKHRCLRKSSKSLLIESNDVGCDQQEPTVHTEPRPPRWTSAPFHPPLPPTLFTVENSGPCSWRRLERNSCGELICFLPRAMSFNWPREESSY